MNTRELNLKIAIWAFGRKNLDVFENGKLIDHFTRKDGQEHVQKVPDLTKPESMGYILTEIFPVLTARCYEPEISYDHEADQWCIIIRDWTSADSRDSIVYYCKEADEIPLGICDCISHLTR